MMTIIINYHNHPFYFSNLLLIIMITKNLKG